jgi:hypothetical protein
VEAAIGLFVGIVIGTCLYFLPTIVAVGRSHPNIVAIALVNYVWVDIFRVGSSSRNCSMAYRPTPPISIATQPSHLRGECGFCSEQNYVS